MRIRTQKIFLNMFQFFTTFPFHTPDIVSFGFFESIKRLLFLLQKNFKSRIGLVGRRQTIEYFGNKCTLIFYFSLISASC